MNTILNFINTYITVFSTFFDFFLLYGVLVSLFVSGSFSKRLSLTGISSVISLLFYLLIDTLIGVRFPNYLLYYLLFGLLFILFFVRQKKSNASLTLLFFVFGSAFLRFMLDSLLRLTILDRISNFAYYNLMSNFLILLCLIGYAWFLIRFFIPSNLHLPWYYQLPLIFLFIVFFVFLKLAGYFSENMAIFTTYFFLMIFMVFMVYFLFFHIARDNEERMKNQLLIQEIQLKEAHIHETQKLYQNLRVLRHELKNHMFYLKTLSDQKEYEKLTEYVNEFTQSYQKASEFIETGNITINAILQSYCSLARERQIDFSVNASLPETLNIPDGALFSLLSNLLDNAVEGIDPDAPSISVELKMVKAYLSITVKNTVSTNILVDNPVLRTTKLEKEKHGIGTQIIKHITEEYNGILEYFCENGIFTVSILLTNDLLSKDL